MSRLIANARLADGRVVDLRVGDDGRFTSIDDVGREASDAPPDPPGDAVDRVDVDGRLVLPAMAEPHAHVDKALTAEMVPNPTGDLQGAIEAWVAAAEAGVFTYEDMVGRVRRALELLLLNGVTAVRSHVNCGRTASTWHLGATQEAAIEFAGAMDVQLVALVHTPLTGPGSEDNRRTLREAVELGVDLVGGAPHLEPDGPAAIEFALGVAADAGIGFDLHVDETLDPHMLTLRDVARTVIDRSFDGIATASHCVSLGMQTPEVQAAVSAEVAEAGVSIVTLPQTNLFLQGRDHPTATPRGLTAIAALREAGALVVAGGDNVQDPFNLVGRSDPLETAALLVMAGHVLPDDAYEMVSNDARRALGLDPVRFEAGSPADIVAIEAPSIRAAIADAPADRMVFQGGRLVASTSVTRVVHRPV